MWGARGRGSWKAARKIVPPGKKSPQRKSSTRSFRTSPRVKACVGTNMIGGGGGKRGVFDDKIQER